MRKLLLSVHDVMPVTLEPVERIVRNLEQDGLLPVTLLVVPDTGWDRSSLSRLRALIGCGAELAGHGWRHVVPRIRGIRHRLHSAFVSRDVAEHLALDRDGIASLINRCYSWFGEHELPRPGLYVPPAWAMGKLEREDLAGLPFTHYELLGGVVNGATGRLHRTPMVGFEADTALRAAACRAWNAVNRATAGRSRPLRVAIHPRDPELRLASDLRRLLDDGGRALSYADIGDRHA